MIKTALASVAALAMIAGGVASAQYMPDETDGPQGPVGTIHPNRGGDGGGFFKGKKKDKGNPGPCPLMGALYDSARMVEVKGAEKFENIGFTAEILSVHGLCTYSGASPIDMNMDIDMAFGRGPAADGDTHVYRYWVAVTRTNVGPLAKEYFDIPVKFEKGQERVFHTEKIKQIVIPRANATVAGPAFEVLVGYELTPDQLAFNRAGKRFKMNVGADSGG
jgi:hypothetical protein